MKSTRERLVRRLGFAAAQTTAGGVVMLVAVALRAYLRYSSRVPPRRRVRRRRDPIAAGWKGTGGDIW